MRRNVNGGLLGSIFLAAQRLNCNQDLVLLDQIASLVIDGSDGASVRTADRVLHLHRLQDEQTLIRTHLIALRDIDLDHLAGHR